MQNTLEQEMYNYFNQLNEIQKRSVILMLKSFLLGKGKESAPIDIQQYNREIDEAVARVEGGEFYTQEEVEGMSREW